MNVPVQLMRHLGWSVRMRELGLRLRIRQYVTLAVVMASMGSAIGYAVARRGVIDPGAESDADQAG